MQLRPAYIIRQVKSHRHLKGISQKKLGSMLNVDGATISGWEKSESQPHQQTLNKIHALFNEIWEVAFSTGQSNRIA